MQLLHGILVGTPLWVWALFAYGIFAGARAFKERKVAIAVMAIMPALFLFLSLPALLGVMGPNPLVGAAWALCLAAGALLAWRFLCPEPLSVDRSRGTLVVPGTWTLLILFIVIFAVKYVYNIALAVDPALAGDAGFLLFVFGLSGLSTGIVGGRTARYVTAFLRVPAALAK